MAKRKNTSKKQDNKNIKAVEEALSKSEQFIERNQKPLTYTIAIIVLIISGYIGYTRFVLAPREKAAQEDMSFPQKHFEMGDFKLALEGDSELALEGGSPRYNPGFLDIMDEFSRTKSANLARYYAGISLIHLGEFEEGIDYLKQFRTRDQLLGSMKYGAIGDAYWELGELEKAASYYRRAYQYKPDKLTTPAYLFKAGLLYEQKGEFAEAIKLYERIRKEYSNSNEGRDIEKYIARATASK